ncbi:hypothetical protein TNCV_950051 [Trichonephila clavipes]|nr:hypothetical protein TNCV_950051 [Trichonephila clavipes]
MIRWALKLTEFNIKWEHRPGVQNVVADVLSRNPIGNMDGSQISSSVLRALTLNSREQLSFENNRLSHQQMIRQFHPPTEERRTGARIQYDKARETRSTHRKRHSTAKGRPVRSRQTTAVRPCPYYLRSPLKEPEGIP